MFRNNFGCYTSPILSRVSKERLYMMHLIHLNLDKNNKMKTKHWYVEEIKMIYNRIYQIDCWAYKILFILNHEINSLNTSKNKCRFISEMKDGGQRSVLIPVFRRFVILFWNSRVVGNYAKLMQLHMKNIERQCL